MGNNGNLIQTDVNLKPTYNSNDSIMNNKPSVFFYFIETNTFKYNNYLQCNTYNSNTSTYNLSIGMGAYMYAPTIYDSSEGFEFFMNFGQDFNVNGTVLIKVYSD